jgi:glutaredoxin 3
VRTKNRYYAKRSVLHGPDAAEMTVHASVAWVPPVCLSGASCCLAIIELKLIAGRSAGAARHDGDELAPTGSFRTGSLIKKYALAAQSFFKIAKLLCIAVARRSFCLTLEHGPRANVAMCSAVRHGIRADARILAQEKLMNTKRKVEVFSAGCPACQEAVDLVNRIACPSCEVAVLDMNDINVAKQARALGIRTVPAVVIDGQLAACCKGAGVKEDALRAAGLGKA